MTNFRILTQDQPQNQENWLLLARAHQVGKEKQLSKEAAKKALEIKPEHELAWYERGLTLWLMNKPGEAVKCFDRAIEL